MQVKFSQTRIREECWYILYTQTWNSVCCITRASQSVMAYSLEYIITGAVYYSENLYSGAV